MTAVSIQANRQGERGNVLFLILIAVALFAALSYAVTQSTRSGSGDASSETSLISSAQLTQYPAGIRTAIVRMIIGGVQVEDLHFNPPSDFGNLPVNGERFGVFHPQGGGAISTLAPSEVLAPGATGQWYFNANGQIEGIGLSDPANGNANDLIAFLPGISSSVCRKINQELGIGDVTPAGPAYTPSAAGDYMDDSYTFPVGGDGADFTIGNAATDEFENQPFGCYENGGTYVYYHVLVER